MTQYSQSSSSLLLAEKEATQNALLSIERIEVHLFVCFSLRQVEGFLYFLTIQNAYLFQLKLLDSF